MGISNDFKELDEEQFGSKEADGHGNLLVITISFKKTR